ncbi:hypothetical protein DFJ43DRAFT_989107 [Lentinula guzmanii]|uniref:CFA20 domain-containing protein n=1 Tax=Lentinula guzmanii TaxID=2804957 RepID=A0AA38JGT5_9AGAR|nr:hypothetical protein DFJ43DRAFT_989107 [Lentinula guzmanii]
MFSAAVQSGLVSLFSSTGSNQLQLFSTHCDESLPSDAYIGLLNDRSSEPQPSGTVSLISPHSEQSGFLLDQTVLHIQSPVPPKTYIQCPAQSGVELGLKHPWIHLQVRNLGREWSFEVGIADRVGRKGIIRFSTFQKQPRLKVPAKSDDLPLLHLPLSFPSDSTQLTAWSTINLHLPTFLPHFINTNLAEHEESIDDLSHAQVSIPSGQYSHISHVRIYSTCRIRRIWLSDGGPTQKLPWEFELYARE